MAQRETVEQALARWRDLELLQEHYSEFEDFLRDVIEDLLGFNCTDLQQDIGQYIAHGPHYRMVQAQRGQAKTTIAAAFAVWRLIHNPKTRILIISAGDTQATEIANWIIQIINNMDELECLRPDRANGDRASVEAYDVHYSLKGAEKSPSVACIGITSNMQGKRADVLLADDIESQKNSATQVQRDRILLLSRDFTSIVQSGEIIYLGTPQSIDSVYNTLPGRGYDVRIWTGRYPTVKERPTYAGHLAPYITSRLDADPSLGTGGGVLGDQGQPTDPVLLDDDKLIKKEIDQGPAYFTLQHMLNTSLMDADRFPLKLANLRITAFDRENKVAPMTINHARTDGNKIAKLPGFPLKDDMYRLQGVDEFSDISGYYMYVDPAGGGQNGDEIAVAITGYLAGRVFLAHVDGRTGGFTEENLAWLTMLAVKWRPKTIGIEKNYGNGAFWKIWEPFLIREHKCGIEEVWESGQKELRIIDILEPVINAGKLVVHEDLIQEDYESIQKYSAEKRNTYSLFWQMARITRDKGALIHDDRLDAVASAVRFWVDHLSQDDEKSKAAARDAAYRSMMKNPLGDGRTPKGWNHQINMGRGATVNNRPVANALSHTRRKF
ncbi:terminase large subunit [Rhizobium phage Paso]|uniref:Terminase large subunit n=1 Tax=Rhizobium phage Paso TaxID=2767574 RepID=A0A7L8G4S0_9CAUD|nr:terminase large subunit [Rhizobium phage Paso]